MVITVAALLLTTAAPAQVATPDEAAVRLAIVQAVRARMGDAAQVRLEHVLIVPGPAYGSATMTATPEPGSRLGRSVRFALRSDAPPHGRTSTTAAGYVTAAVHVSVLHLRVRSSIARGTTLTDAELADSEAEVGVVPFARLPIRVDVAGGRVVRDLRSGEIVTASVVRAQPLVRSGDHVRTRAVFGNVEIFGRAIAQQSGLRHDRIKLINPESRKTLRGVVVGPGEVEVIHEP